MARHLDVPTCIDETLAEWGSTESQRADALIVLPKYCEMVGDKVYLKEINRPLDSKEAREWIQEFKSHLLPRAYEPRLADQAFLGLGNASKMQELARQVGLEQAHEIAKGYGKRDAFDRKTIGRTPEERDAMAARAERAKTDPRKNPWADTTADGERRRIEAIRALGSKVASELARAANVDLAGRPLRRAN
jgi:hypothetical protein